MQEKFRHYRLLLLIVALLVGMLLLYSNNLRHRQKTNLFERAVLAISTPVLQGIDQTIDTIAGTWNEYVWLVGVNRQNKILKEKNRQLEVRLHAYREYQLENERLRALLAFEQTRDRVSLPAEVIGEDMSSWAQTILIDKGTRQGVKEGLPVVVAEGVVGQTIKCGPNQSRVLLITDASAAVAALVQRTRTRGLCRGRGDRLILEFALRQKDLVVGDTIVTSGMGGIFPRGIIVGRVGAVDRPEYGLFQHVEVTPSADFDRLEEVLILLEEDS